jgi:hypothetical protein
MHLCPIDVRVSESPTWTDLASWWDDRADVAQVGSIMEKSPLTRCGDDLAPVLARQYVPPPGYWGFTKV